MANPLGSDREFFAPLHGLRGIAVLYVVVSHLSNEGAHLIPIDLDAIGKVGVWIFFSLSAFLLTTHLYRDFLASSASRARGAPILSYAVNRVFRIFPLYLLVIAAHAVVGDLSLIDALQHVLLIEGWGELWAIPVEFEYYLLIPVIAFAAVAMPRPVVAILLVAGVAGSVSYSNAVPNSVFSNELNIVPRLAPFLLGSALALAMTGSTPKGKAGSRSGSLLITGVCLLGLVSMTVLYRWSAKDLLPESFAPWISLILGISVVGLIYAALQPGPFGKLLAARTLVFLGEISFSLYLLHMFFIRFVTRLANWPDMIEAWAAFALSILSASISYRLIEQPGIRLGKRVGAHLWRLLAQVPAPLPATKVAKSRQV